MGEKSFMKFLLEITTWLFNTWTEYENHTSLPGRKIHEAVGSLPSSRLTSHAGAPPRARLLTPSSELTAKTLSKQQTASKGTRPSFPHKTRRPRFHYAHYRKPSGKSSIRKMRKNSPRQRQIWNEITDKQTQKTRYRWTSVQNRNRPTDVENKLTVTKGGGDKLGIWG